ncbi:MAG: MYXO-CTERM sorting domain-containing protein [Kofleriaceae bacterium]
MASRRTHVGPSVTQEVRPVGSGRLNVYSTRPSERTVSRSARSSGISHIDREWRFQDVDLAAQSSTGKVKLRFELNSDQGFNLGGWTLDDVCIVAAKPAPACEDGSAPPCEGGDGEGAGDEAGCCSTTSSPVAPFGLALLVGGLLIRRRRRA